MPISLLVKLGSAVIHAEEFMGKRGHPVDKSTFDGLVADREVAEFMESWGRKGYLPVKRT